MSFGDVFYVFAIGLFSFMTFVIIRGNFRRKFDEEGKRLDMKEDENTDTSTPKK